MSSTPPSFGINDSDPFSLVGANNPFADKLVLASLTPRHSVQVEIAPSEIGEHIPSSAKQINGMENLSANYQSVVLGAISAASGNDKISLSIGGTSLTALTDFTISTQAGKHATVSASGHKHVGTMTGEAHNDRSRTVDIPPFAGFGASNFGLSIGVAEEYLQSGTWSFKIGHTDEPDKDGNFLCGSSHGLVITAEFEAVDDTNDWTVPEGWVGKTDIGQGANTPSESGKNQTNSSHPRRTVRFEKYVGWTAA